jgi:hypothetical protein
MSARISPPEHPSDSVRSGLQTPTSTLYPDRPDPYSSLHKDTPAHFAGRCRQHHYLNDRRQVIPNWHYEATDYYARIIDRWGFLPKANYYRHAGTIQRQARQPNYPSKWDRIPLDPTMILTHLSGKEILYYTSTGHVCIDIDNKGGSDDAGCAMINRLVHSLIAPAKLHTERSRSGHGWHHYLKTTAPHAQMTLFWKMLGLASALVNEEGTATLDHKVCGSANQLVNIPFFKGEQEWQRYRDLLAVTTGEIQRAIAQVAERFPVLTRLASPEPSTPQPKIAAAPAASERLRGASRRDATPSGNDAAPGHRLWLWPKFIEYADRGQYPDRWEAMYRTATLSVRMGCTQEQYTELYRQHVGDDKSDPRDLSRAYQQGMNYCASHPWTDKQKAQGFHFDQSQVKGIYQLVMDRAKDKGLVLDERGAISTALWNYCLAVSTLHSDGGVSRNGFLTACASAVESGLIKGHVNRDDYDQARGLSAQLGLSTKSHDYVAPRTGTAGRATIYRVCPDVLLLLCTGASLLSAPLRGR